MDRFTRTREHYLKGGPQKESLIPRSALGPSPTADLSFDFQFGESRLDLTLAVGGSTTQDLPRSAAQVGDSVKNQIGIAISEDIEFPQRGRLRISKPCTITIQNHKEQGLDVNQDVTALPPIPSEVHIRFNARNNTDSNKPSCSIYSREDLRKVRSEITQPGQMAGNDARIDTSADPSKISGAPTAVVKSPETNSAGELSKSPTIERELCIFTKDQTYTSPSRYPQTTPSSQRNDKNKTKRPSAFRKIFTPFKRAQKPKKTITTIEDDIPNTNKPPSALPSPARSSPIPHLFI